MKTKHFVIISWSEEDKAFIAECREFTGCISHGDTRNEALTNLELVVAEYHKSAKELGWKDAKAE